MEDLFTLIITHYNQEDYIYDALNSALKQDYANIELIITDDYSKKFPKNKIEEYIEKNKKGNIKNIKFILNDRNLGTTKTLNKAISNASGKYISFFAADDELYNSKVISNYVKSFKKYNQKIITAQSFEYDKFLKNCKCEYVDLKRAYKNNFKSSMELFEEMAKSCLYASGATAYESSIFKNYGLFNEDYKLVEDWSYWLYILKKGAFIYFVNFPALKHREGGVSHYMNNDLPPHVKVYYYDLLKIIENEILLDMPKAIKRKNKLLIYKRAEEIVDFYLEELKSSENEYYHKLIKESIQKNIGSEIKKAKLELKVHNFIKWQVYMKWIYFKNNRALFISTILWILSNILMKNYYISILPEKIAIDMAITYIVILFATKLLNSFSKNLAICFPLTILIVYNLLKKWEITNILICMFLGILIYFIIYYIYLVISIILKKKQKKKYNCISL